MLKSHQGSFYVKHNLSQLCRLHCFEAPIIYFYHSVLCSFLLLTACLLSVLEHIHHIFDYDELTLTALPPIAR